MDEYISREIAMERIKYKKPKVLYSEYGVGYERGLEDAIGLLNAISAADVQPVKHGRWIIADDVEHFIAVCSECGRTEDSRGIKDMPYCHCGARMGGDIE